MSKAYVLALMGDNAKAHAELGKAHQAASSRDEASDDANADSGDYKLAGGGFCPDAAMSLLRESNPVCRILMISMTFFLEGLA
jgi:hypothetical protein